jgi:hypothetical protein
MTPYVERILLCYRNLPHTCGRVGPRDHLLAQSLEHRGVPLDLVEAALYLAALRRLCRPPDAQRLPTVRSLHYFLPVIEELEDAPPDPGYFAYLRDRLHRLNTTGI